MKQDEPAHPVYVGLLGPIAVVATSNFAFTHHDRLRQRATRKPMKANYVDDIHLCSQGFRELTL